MDGDGANLTALATRYVAVKAKVVAELKGRRAITRFGGNSSKRTTSELARVARVEAARRLGAKVSPETLEKISWLQTVAGDATRQDSIRRAAREALLAIDGGSGVDDAFNQVLARASLAEVEAVVVDDNADPVARQFAEWWLPRLLTMQRDKATPEQLAREAWKAAVLIKRAGRSRALTKAA